MVYECGRFWGRNPTYYIFNGMEHERSRQYLSISRADETSGSSKNMLKAHRNDRFQTDFEQASSLVFANDRSSIHMPKVLAIMGEAPKFFRNLNTPLDGEFSLTKEQAAGILKASPLLKGSWFKLVKHNFNQRKILR